FFMILLLIIFSCVMMYSVVLRYIFNSAPSWAEEFCRYCYIWSVALSLSFCVQRDSAMKMSVIMDLFPTKIRNAVSIIAYALQLAMFGMLAYAAWEVLQQVIDTGTKSTTMGIPMSFMYFSYLLGTVLAVVRCGQKIAHQIRHFNEKQLTTLEQTILDAKAEAELASADLKKSEGGDQQ
ncbi:MAG: TRAP transporter small permease, partial [Muribaculaceae bacterium]|nr:TRAP transporter small permease [Muribaculaceae bacterium]